MHTSTKPRHSSFRRLQLWLVFLAVLPVALGASIALALLGRQQEYAAEQRLVERTRAVATATEIRLEAQLQRLHALASARTLVVGDIAGFAAQAQTVVDDGEFLEVGLLDMTGRTRISVAQRSPVVPREAVDRLALVQDVVRTGRLVSDVMPSPLTGHQSVVVGVVAASRGKNAGFVLIGIPDLQRAFLSLLTRQRLPEGEGGGAIMDRHGVYIARTLNPETSVGQLASAAYRARALASSEGIMKNTNPEGQSVYGTFVHTSFGWITALGVPASEMERPYREALFAIGGLWLVASLFCGLLAVVFGRRITAGLQRLAAAASELGRGGAPASGDESIAEIDVARHALVTAAEERDRLIGMHSATRDAADAANRAKDQFVAIVSHELRNPLNAIAGAAGVLRRVASNTEALQPVAIIERQTVHLSRIVADLLDVAELSSGKVRLEREAIDLLASAERVVDTLRAAGSTGQHDVSVTGTRAWVLGDADRIEQIITNLVGNALKHTPAGGRIDVATDADDLYAVLHVADTGPGIANELLPRIFDLFVQGGERSGDARQGLGIGLAVVRQLVELHGGTVEVRSDGAGRGSRFTVRFPQHSPSPSQQPAPSEAAAPLRIVIVEDNADARTMLKVFLTQLGHEVYEAGGGLEAVRIAADVQPDIVLADIALPDIDGYDVARRLRADERTAKISLVAVTGYGAKNDVARAFEAGFDLHLVKPLQFDRIQEALLTLRTVRAAGLRLADLIVSKVDAGLLPSDDSAKIRITYGHGGACSACGRPIAPAQTEHALDIDGQTRFRFHMGCFGLWKAALIRRGRSHADPASSS
jgi:signal transduction histidine kinase/CheY-like chemotaxis protein